MITSTTEFLQILRAIVIHHKPADLCGRLNTFAVLDRMTQLNADNAEMTLEHYQQGLFWARDWYNKGASPNKLTKEYDILTVEAIKGATKSNLTDLGYTATFFISAVGTVNKTEKSCPSTVEGKRAQLMDTLNGVLAELMTYQKFEITPATGSPFTGWASSAQVEALTTSGFWIEADETGLMLDASLRQAEFFLYVPEWNSLSPFRGNTTGKTTLVDNVVAVTTQIDLEICSEADVFSFKYDTPNVAALGVVKCEC